MSPSAARQNFHFCPARALHLVDDLIRTHIEQRLGEPRVAPLPDVVLDLRRVDPVIHPEHDAHLVLVERDRLLGGDPPPRRFGNATRHLIEQPLDHLAARDRFLDDIGQVVRTDTAV
jgi:hypothetical protein